MYIFFLPKAQKGKGKGRGKGKGFQEPQDPPVDKDSEEHGDWQKISHNKRERSMSGDPQGA